MSSFLLQYFYGYFNKGNMEKKATFRIDETILKRLKYLAVDQDRSLTDLYLEAIQDLLKKYEKQPKD